MRKGIIWGRWYNFYYYNVQRPSYAMKELSVYILVFMYTYTCMCVYRHKHTVRVYVYITLYMQQATCTYYDKNNPFSHNWSQTLP